MQKFSVGWRIDFDSCGERSQNNISGVQRRLGGRLGMTSSSTSPRKDLKAAMEDELSVTCSQP